MDIDPDESCRVEGRTNESEVDTCDESSDSGRSELNNNTLENNLLRYYVTDKDATDTVDGFFAEYSSQLACSQLTKHLGDMAESKNYQSEVKSPRKVEVEELERLAEHQSPHKCDQSADDGTRLGQDDSAGNRSVERGTTDTMEKKYQCEVCQKSFETTWKLARHQRTHSGERPSECPKCEKTFSSNSYLNLHLRLHCRGQKRGTTDTVEKKTPM